jgi:hypothetical protein
LGQSQRDETSRVASYTPLKHLDRSHGARSFGGGEGAFVWNGCSASASSLFNAHDIRALAWYREHLSVPVELGQSRRTRRCTRTPRPVSLPRVEVVVAAGPVSYVVRLRHEGVAETVLLF